MNPEQLKLMLSAARPEGQDDAEPSLREALAAAQQDESLGKWLEAERAADREFSARLAEVRAPEGLRDEILAGMYLSSGARRKPAEDAPETDAPGKVIFLNRPATWGGLAVAAALAVLLTVSVLLTERAPQNNRAVATASIVPPLLSHLTQQLEPGKFPGFDMQSDCVHTLQHYQGTHSTPTPQALPSCLAEQRALGCLSLKFEGHPIGLLCFDNGDNQTLHLFTGDASMAGKLLPLIEGTAYYEAEGYHYRVWQDSDQVYILASKLPISCLRQLQM